MILNLTEDFRLSSDPYQWILEQRTVNKNKKTGETYDRWNRIAFFGSLDHAIRHAAQRGIRCMDAEVPIAAHTETLQAIWKLEAGLHRALSQMSPQRPVAGSNQH